VPSAPCCLCNLQAGEDPLNKIGFQQLTVCKFTRPRSFRNQPNPDEQVIQRRPPVTDRQIVIFAGIFGIQVGDIFP
jgi:hypothetical protein